jgi:uncharacterized SAM-binding protein YcdF (DUF218 family)
MDTLFFVTAKLFWTLAQPASWLVGLFVVALALAARGRWRAARGWLAGGTIALLLLGLLPLGAPVIRPLESRFPTAPEVTAPAGIIVLGGGEDAALTAETGIVQVNEGGDRLLAGLALARRHPDAQLIFTGGSARLAGGGVPGAEAAGRLFEAVGLPPERVTLESRARNTAENARLTAARVADPAAGPWLLVTSAFHMPRSVGAFCAAGWRGIVPYPVDHRPPARMRPGWDLAGHLGQLETAVKEWIGLLAYRVTGRSDALLPAGC